MALMILHTTGRTICCNDGSSLVSRRGCGLMIWERFSGRGKSKIVIGNLNAVDFSNMLDGELLPFVYPHYHNTPTFQYENSSAHSVTYIKEWFMDAGINFLDCTARSPRPQSNRKPIGSAVQGVVSRNAHVRPHRWPLRCDCPGLRQNTTPVASQYCQLYEISVHSGYYEAWWFRSDQSWFHRCRANRYTLSFSGFPPSFTKG